MANSVTQDGIATVLSSQSSSSVRPEIVVQVIDLKPVGNRYTFNANDGKKKIKVVLPATLTSDIISGKIQNLGLIRLLDYTANDIPGNSEEKYLLVTKCEVVACALDSEIKDSTGIVLKPKDKFVAKSASQRINEQSGNAAPAARMAMTRRVHPLVSLSPYQGSWTIKVRVTNKGVMKNYKNARGEGCVFYVELTDEEGTQIQATMFNAAAKKFYDTLQMGKVFYISKGSLKLANNQFKTVQNDYEMTLNENSVVEESKNEEMSVPETKFNFVPIDELGAYVNQKDLIDVIGVVQSVSPTMSIRRKSDNEMIPKRDITLADETKKTVVVSLWNDLATGLGQELLDMADKYPIIAIKSLKVGDFQGVSLSTVSRSNVVINPDIPEATKLRSWYDSEGKETSMSAIGSGMSPSANNGSRAMYSDRVCLSHFTTNPSLGTDKPVFFSTRAYISFIKPDQVMWYRACKTCHEKVTEAMYSGYWCENCQKKNEEYSLRYIMAVKVSDSTGEAWFSAFNDEAEKIIGCTADELRKLKSEEGKVNKFQTKLKEATWSEHLFRVSVSQQEYNSEKRQKITVKSVSRIDFAAETRLLLRDISKNKNTSQF
ncbi:unnamed protein product [Eruca vesicaria subsp. sativa]|uniref:Replication protein A subunit n=1 Tax=Eruca vesicaria subsp. sativa TaxID=29727 RepID=A0ABC8J3S5_ERUVS|nr:unnamed protein product [Eruca vesicaria subsp. sativa]